MYRQSLPCKPVPTLCRASSTATKRRLCRRGDQAGCPYLNNTRPFIICCERTPHLQQLACVACQQAGTFERGSKLPRYISTRLTLYI
jgi:hypothetical protein